MGSRGTKADHETIFDLRIEELISDILGRDKDQFLLNVFEEPLTDRDAINFRLSIFTDLLNQSVYNAVTYFVDAIKDCKRLMNLEGDLYDEFKYGFHIDAALTYVNALENSWHLMDGLNLKSEGMTYFASYLKDLINGEGFKALKRATYEAKAARDRITVRIRISGLEVKVNRDENGEDLASKIEELFSRFKGQPVQELKPLTYLYNQQVTHVHAAILRGVYKVFREEFDIMKRLKDDFPDLVDEGIGSFAKEFEFYVRYIDYMRGIEANGYRFSIPRFTEDGSVHVKGFYNLLLAKKKVAVANDIRTSGDKRVFIITGVNGGGKTTFAISFGQLAFLSSIGVPVPAEEAELPAFSKIATVFPTGEGTLEGLSRLEEDVARVRKVLGSADSKTLVIVNELFSTTTSEEGFELARRFIGKIKDKGSYLLYVTFITRLAALEGVIPLSTVVEDDRITYRIVEGAPDSRSMAVRIASRYHLLYEDIRGALN